MVELTMDIRVSSPLALDDFRAGSRLSLQHTVGSERHKVSNDMLCSLATSWLTEEFLPRRAFAIWDISSCPSSLPLAFGGMSPMYSVEASGENWWLYFRASYLLWTFLFGSRNSSPNLLSCAAETFLLLQLKINWSLWDSWEVKVLQILGFVLNMKPDSIRAKALTCFVTRVLSDSSKSQKPTSKH